MPYKAVFIFCLICSIALTMWVVLGDNGQAAVLSLFH